MMAMTYVFNVGKILLPLFCDPDMKNASQSQTLMKWTTTPKQIRGYKHKSD